MMRTIPLAAFGICLVSVVSAVAGVWPSGREKVSLEARPFDLRDVRLLDGPFRENLERDRKYLHDLEADRLLYYFRETAGLAAPGEPLGGWEQSEVRGHTMGHFLSAMAMMVAATSDDALKAKADRIVAELARCQKAHTDGYLSAFPKSHIDRVIAREPVWAPWYVLHKILAGLIDVHVYCDNPQALEVAQELSGWMEKRLASVDRDAMQRMLDVTEQGGMNEALANLYGLTGDRRWWNLSLRFVEDHYVEPLSRGEDRLKGEHANSFIPNIVGTARQFELGGDPRDRRIAEFFWNQVAATRCYSTGGTSLDEHWKSDPGKLADQLGDFTEETCCTYNLLKLTHHLLAWQPDRKYADYYERALVNGILATQDPKTGMMEYFVTLASGRWKYFHTPRTSFWCCTGTGMENHARYGEAIYAHNADSLWVNLFIASELTWKEKGVRIRQETQFPNQEHSSLLVKADKAHGLRPASSRAGVDRRQDDGPPQRSAAGDGRRRNGLPGNRPHVVRRRPRRDRPAHARLGMAHARRPNTADGHVRPPRACRKTGRRRAHYGRRLHGQKLVPVPRGQDCPGAGYRYGSPRSGRLGAAGRPTSR